MERKIKGLDILKRISKIISWSVIVLLIIIILFLAMVVVTTKVNERMNKAPIFSLYTIISPSMVPNINVYDVVFVSKVNTKKLEKGDVISFYVRGSTLGKTPVTHRITGVSATGTGEYTFSTKGDAVAEEDKWRYPVTESDIVGKVLFKLPQLGRIQFFLTSKTGWFLVILLPALGIIAFDLYKLMRLLIIRSKIAEERIMEEKQDDDVNNEMLISENNNIPNEINENISINNFEEKPDVLFVNENKSELSDSDITISNNSNSNEIEAKSEGYINDNNLCDKNNEQEILYEIIDLDKKLNDENNSDLK